MANVSLRSPFEVNLKFRMRVIDVDDIHDVHLDTNATIDIYPKYVERTNNAKYYI